MLLKEHSMPNRMSPSVGLVIAALSIPLGVQGQAPLKREDAERSMGLRSQGDLVRGQLDTVGFVVTREQAEDVVPQAIRMERERLTAAPDVLVAAVCPHDDHLYAAGVHVHATQRIAAPRVVLVGVFHRAREWQLRDRIVFDRFQAWHGPWGPVPVDPLREELVAALPPGDVVADNTIHCREHSLEGIVPFLQHRHRDLSIVPILVPYMGWDRMEQIAERLGAALAAAVRRHGWVLGRDLAVVISTDLVHYGGDFDHAPFGEDGDGYREAVARDLGLIRGHLEGPVEPERLRDLLHELVDREDVTRYRIPWCGRFSVPFGLETVRVLTERLGLGRPEGTLLRFGTSVSEPELAVSRASRDAGLGYTAPSNFHHWVAYGAVGYTLPNP
jgi:AmmeMemoRadiSam system protein B